MLTPGQITQLTIEKPAAGGRMIARLGGQVVLVAGAIPGEVVSARIERVGKGVAFASTVSVEEPSVDRREPFTDPLCGGCLYAHMTYARQLVVKGQVIADAFGRIGRLPLPVAPLVAASRDEGYRMRARLHLRGAVGGAGFFREGTHDICDARATRQLLPATCDAIDRVVEVLRLGGYGGVGEIEVSENIEASERVVHVDANVTRGLAGLEGIAGLTGLAAGDHVSGDPYVTDTVVIDDRAITLRRHVLAFFQGNRYLLRDLMAHVVCAIDPGSSVVELYAGVGIFSIAAAVARGARVTAVEGDAVAARDLHHNAAAAGGAVEAVHQDVETFTSRPRPRPDVLIVDPPRTGMSNAALQGAISLRARRLLYVSCDVATLARDARRLADAGYLLERVDAFDLFPNTPHVETVVRFEDVGK